MVEGYNPEVESPLNIFSSPDNNIPLSAEQPMPLNAILAYEAKDYKYYSAYGSQGDIHILGKALVPIESTEGLIKWGAFLAYGGQELFTTVFHVPTLSRPYKWVVARRGEVIPKYSLRGPDERGEPAYFARLQGEAGKCIVLANGVIKRFYYPLNGKERYSDVGEIIYVPQDDAEVQAMTKNIS